MAESAHELTRRLTTQDASFLYAESHSSPLHISSLGLFEGEIAPQALGQQIEARLHLLPRYRQRLSFAPLNMRHPTWEDDSTFRLDGHLRHYRLPDGANESLLIRAAARISERALDRSRPLWEMHLFTGLSRDRSALLTKVHHCMIDGISGIDLLAITMDFRPDAPPGAPPESPFVPVPAPSPRSMLDSVVDWVLNAPDSARLATDAGAAALRILERLGPLSNAGFQLANLLARPIAPTPWNSGPVTSARAFSCIEVSFADLRKIRNAFGGTTNDVVLAILSESAARYLKHHRTATFGLPLRIGCPVSVRRKGERGALGNRVSMMFPEFNSSPMDVIARLREVKAETERIKSSGQAQALESLMSIAGFVPPGLIRLGAGMASSALDLFARFTQFAPWATRLFPLPPLGINFIATNVPGVQVPLYLAGRRMDRFIGMIGLGGNLGYGVAICSYNQNLCFALSAEPRLMPDVGRMKSYIRQTFEELRRAARKVSVMEPRSLPAPPPAETAEQLRATG